MPVSNSVRAQHGRQSIWTLAASKLSFENYSLPATLLPLKHVAFADPLLDCPATPIQNSVPECIDLLIGESQATLPDSK